MKKYTIIILFWLLPIFVLAQDNSGKMFYNTFDFSFHATNSDMEFASENLKYTKGVGIKYTMGYHWKYWMDFGVGLGFDMYRLDGDDTRKHPFVPMFMELRGKVLDRKNAPYYELGMGYAFNFTKTSWDFYHKNGGLYFRPAVGYQFEMKNDFMMSAFIGYQLQQEVSRRDDESIIIQIYLPEGSEFYQRMVMGVKLGF